MCDDPELKESILDGDFEPLSLVDSNTQLSERVLRAIAVVPSSSDIIYRLSNENIVTKVRKIHQEFSLHEMLHPSVNDIDAHDSSFLFYHGGTTIKRELARSINLQVPNKLAKLDYLDRVKNILSLSEKLFSR